MSDPNQPSGPNRLADSTSPYLRQHANNPVDWYGWGPEALARAKHEDKPILLSVGYSACHWCHVMAHESFEDPAIAALMNAHFVNIKVDREERPDIDAIYQKVVALMGQGGGWPLTVFLTPDQRPFYGGTYFPAQDRYGRPGFAKLLVALSELWTERRDDALSQAQAFMNGFAELAKSIDEDAASGVDLSLASPGAWADAGRRLVERIDPQWGGLGRAPKFPNVPGLQLLLGRSRDQPQGDAGPALRLTLEKMWRGGIYDHLRGGFARYSTDREWLIPHFEKMLYDNALLLALYAEASVAFGATGPLAYLRRVVEETADYLTADMRSEGEAFYSATDADSEGVEGKYFCWTPAQLEDALGEAMGKTFARAHGVTRDGNFEHGMSALHRPEPIPPALDLELAPARAKLLELRYGRVPPLRDEKLLTAWNALAISGFCRAAEAAHVWGEAKRVEQWTNVARRAAETILTTHRDADTRLLRASYYPQSARFDPCSASPPRASTPSLRSGPLVGPSGGTLRSVGQGVAHTRAYLEDVALLGRACLDLHELTLEPRWHDEAEALARELMAHYAREGGGFFTTADDGEQLIERTESQHDSPLPSGLAAAVELLARLDLGGPAGHGAPPGTREQIEQTLSRFPTASAQPFAFAGLINAAQWASDRAVHVTIRAASPEQGQALAAAIRERRGSLASPVAISFMIRPEAAGADALVCRAQTCSMPITEIEALLAALG
ncbi:Thymidylate kinase [Enhygromyxa salina]|uniref:Thymidylate kinase n=1 Tax=Enhygromyxa salina TaxID=215803 RepID=A0A0C2CR85_9BACT|nr:thioredoxin domain-containing protein [Enhygromyxa salina]KIG13681.1 Thymidylate kinase [Enhygromyxa salina]